MDHGDERESKSNRIELTELVERIRNGLVSWSGEIPRLTPACRFGMRQDSLQFRLVYFTSQCWALSQDRKRDQSRKQTRMSPS
jgi:hypothetical protein